MEVVIATHNSDKVKEFKEILQDSNIHFIGLDSLGEHYEVEEDGTSYLENADIKAKEAYRRYQRPVLADDSGLSVNLLDGYPGIYSARFAGKNTNYTDKIARLQELLRDYPPEEWTASFNCALSYISETGRKYNFTASVQGLILPEMRGRNGFGYDPIFYVPELGKTTAELSPAQKHAISHRGLALQQWYQAWKKGELV